MKSDAQRMAEMRSRRRSEGLVQVTVWVPAEMVDSFRNEAKRWVASGIPKRKRGPVAAERLVAAERPAGGLVAAERPVQRIDFDKVSSEAVRLAHSKGKTDSYASWASFIERHISSAYKRAGVQVPWGRIKKFVKLLEQENRVT